GGKQFFLAGEEDDVQDRFLRPGVAPGTGEVGPVRGRCGPDRQLRLLLLANTGAGPIPPPGRQQALSWTAGSCGNGCRIPGGTGLRGPLAGAGTGSLEKGASLRRACLRRRATGTGINLFRST